MFEKSNTTFQVSHLAFLQYSARKHWQDSSQWVNNIVVRHVRQNPSLAISSLWGQRHGDWLLSNLTTCSNVGTEGRVDQTRTPFQRQATELGDQQEVESCPGQLLSGTQQPRQLLDQLTRYREGERYGERQNGRCCRRIRSDESLCKSVNL